MNAMPSTSALPKLICAGDIGGSAINHTRPAASASIATSRPKGNPMPAAIRTPATGGPMNCPVSCSVLQSWPLAASRSCGSTMSGRMVWAALSRRTSAEPSRKASPTRIQIAFASGSLMASSMMTRTIPARRRSARAISLRRSVRSMTTPAGSAKSNQGNRPAAATAPIAIGSRVMSAASHGSASTIRPSPKLVSAPAVNRSR